MRLRNSIALMQMMVSGSYYLVAGGFRWFSILSASLYLYSGMNVHKNKHTLK